MGKKTSKNDRIHGAWKILGVREGRFEYQCKRCQVKVLSGQPFSEAGATECKS
jgi:hypothetical protein